jgi:hypothetical protein
MLHERSECKRGSAQPSINERSGRSARPEGRSREKCERDSAQPSIVGEVLRQGFQLANHRPRLIFLDLAWKSIWLVLTLAGLFLVAIWFGSEFRALVWADTGNRAVNGAIAVALLRRFWLAKHAAIFAAVSAVLFLSLVAWFLLEASVRARIVWADSSPQLRGREPRPRSDDPLGRSINKGLGWGGVSPKNHSLDQHHSLRLRAIALALRARRVSPRLSRHLSSAEEGDSAFHIFLLSAVLKHFFIATALFALAAICFGRYFVTPFSEWPQLWPDTRGAFFITVVTIAALGFFLTILDTLVRNDAIELLGTDLFRVTGLITILLWFETMIVTSCAMMLGVGLLSVAGLKSAVAMLVATAAAVGLLNLLHSYLLLVRYLAVGILRQNVVEI